MSKQHGERFVAICNDAKARIEEISAATTQAMLQAGEAMFLVDVREKSEWTSGHAVGAIHLGKGVIERDIEKTIPDVNSTIVLYCGGGYRSALAADALQRMGYRKVYSMAGGWRAWLAGAPRRRRRDRPRRSSPAAPRPSCSRQAPWRPASGS